MSIFNILGPAMIGPSSSHTAGAVNIGRVARQIFGNTPAEVKITLYGSFAATYQGHGTDRALVAGILDFFTDDPKIKDALKIAEKENVKVDFLKSNEHLYHPNAARIECSRQSESSAIVAVSLGGGRIRIKEINNFQVDIAGNYNTLLCAYQDQLGVIARVSQVFANKHVNIATMTVSRENISK